MHAALALLPPAVVLVAVLGLRASGLVAASAAAAAAVALWLSGLYAAVEPAQAGRALADAGVLTALVAAMIVPGVLFVEATRGLKSTEAIADLVSGIGVSGGRATILVATGIGVLVESLTGMGVSLLVTMPLLLATLDKRRAIAVALVGMSLMPWGALAISAHVGAKLAGLPVEKLTPWIVAVSGPVAFCLPCACLLLVGERRAGEWVVGLVSGVALVASIAVASLAIGVEVAGVAGGLGVMAFVVALSRPRTALGPLLTARGLLPYIVLIVAVGIQKLGLVHLDRLGLSPRIATGRVDFALLTSPGVALLAATLIAAGRGVTPAVLAVVASRAWRPVAAIALFMLAARLMVECGAIAALAQSLGGLGRVGATVAVGLLGAVGGFVTGSGVTGNALFMPGAAAAGASLGVLPILAALQNGASGHAGMASLPVAAILLATLPSREPGNDALVMRTALALAAWHVTVATCAALALVVSR